MPSPSSIPLAYVCLSLAIADLEVALSHDAVVRWALRNRGPFLTTHERSSPLCWQAWGRGSRTIVSVNTLWAWMRLLRPFRFLPPPQTWRVRLHVRPNYSGIGVWRHIWKLPVLHYWKIMAIYPYPFLVVINQFFSCIIFIKGCISIWAGSPV